MYIQWGFSSLFKGEIKKVSKYSISHWLVSKDHCGSQGILPVAANWFLISLLCFIYILYAELLPPTKIESTNVIKKIWKELELAFHSMANSPSRLLWPFLQEKVFHNKEMSQYASNDFIIRV